MIGRIKSIVSNDNFLSLFGNMVFAVLSFSSIFILARSFDKIGFGDWILYLNAVTFVEMIRIGISRTPMVRFLAGAKTSEESATVIGSGWAISLMNTGIFAIIIFVLGYFFADGMDRYGFKLFFLWYPLLSIVILPFNNSLSILQARRAFGSIILLRGLTMGSFILFLVGNIFIWKLPVEYVVYAHMGSNLLGSLLGISVGWSGIQYLMKYTKQTIKTLLNFGKFTLGTLLGSNLLKSSDTILLGMMMTSAEAAIYAIPLKLVEMLEIPLRSFVAVALPRMSKASREGNDQEVRNIFYRYSGVLSLLFIPLLIILFFAAEPLIYILGGKEYSSIDVPINVFRIFLIYGLFLVVDRFTGVTLDSINKPKSNLIKVIYMALANIIGDIIAIYYFKSLEAVAMVTIINVLIGVAVGMYYTRKELSITLWKIPKVGWEFIRKNEIRNLRNDN
jgi:O-antigen/teichoic acid export membrane protein